MTIKLIVPNPSSLAPRTHLYSFSSIVEFPRRGNQHASFEFPCPSPATEFVSSRMICFCHVCLQAPLFSVNKPVRAPFWQSKSPGSPGSPESKTAHYMFPISRIRSNEPGCMFEIVSRVVFFLGNVKAM